MTAPKTVAKPLPKIFRHVTDTPLARLHTHQLIGEKPRTHKPIPWSSFRASDYTDNARACAFEAIRMLATGEYLAIEGFSRVLSAMAYHDVPIDILSMAASIPTDEIRHAEIALRCASLIAETTVDKVGLDVPRLRPKKAPDVRGSIADLDAIVAVVAAIGETLSCALLTGCRNSAKSPMIKGVFSHILTDEVHHGRFGWYYLMWRAPMWTKAEKQLLADRVGEEIAGLEVRFYKGRDLPKADQKSLAALGILDTPKQRAVVSAVIENEIIPGLDALGLGASHAWAARKRLPS